MGKLQKPQNRKSKRRSVYRYSCSACKYTSSRRFNIVRHEFRIHSASTRPRRCCGVLLKTKGDYYLHCEVNHPNSRPTNITSRYKYKIVPEFMMPRSPSNTYPVTSSPKNLQASPYMLRSRVRPKTCVDDTGIELDDSIDDSPKLESVCKVELEDPPMENSADLQQSSGYETKTSINSSFDSADENNVMELSCTEERNECQKLHYEELLCTKNASEEAEKVEPIESDKIEKITAGHGGNSAVELQELFDQLDVSSQKSEGIKSPEVSLDLSMDMSLCPDQSKSKESDTDESKDMKISSDNGNLPLKKQILLKFRLSSRENNANARKPVGDRLPKPLKLVETPIRKKHRLSKKMKCRNWRKGINLSRYSSASSDAENVSPLSGTTGKQETWTINVDLRRSGIIQSSWDGITRQMREHLGPIDFDSFKMTPR